MIEATGVCLRLCLCLCRPGAEGNTAAFVLAWFWVHNAAAFCLLSPPLVFAA